jgi:hypothetical protein
LPQIRETSVRMCLLNFPVLRFQTFSPRAIKQLHHTQLAECDNVVDILKILLKSTNYNIG